ncbi:DUF2070 family protein [Halapricum hydrolyticum]|uniref:DUF2070 family protein n=1 Tax=Halapricum hydrolyticum TaxID=2979991 RepID=A0AAE3ID58_9EURY|nr:DUF2070 family protein [Halapricum hydrolyticum]MCU4719106.1 DUF2070 family protein [Halapricum hydrolyticum]MCU4728122.1 DUF2070 family protein [Halapricum hydrolyticum]
MTATQGNLAALSRFVFRTPRWYTTLTFALAIAAVSGVAAFDSAFVLDDAWQGVFFVGLPTVVASLLTAPLDRRLGGRLTYSHASLLALFSELLVIGVLTAAAVVALLTPLGQPFVFDALLLALAAIFAVRLLVVLAVSRHRLALAALPASIQTVVAAALLVIYTGTLRSVEAGGPLIDRLFSRANQADLPIVFHPQDLLLLALMCLVYAGAVWLFLVVIDRPWRRSLGVSALGFVSGFMGHLAEGTRELENFFEEIGETAVVPVSVLSFRRLGTTDERTEKARFVLPMIHPGPMGDIGGGNLPVRIDEHTDGLAFPPHATAGHDFNLVTEREVGTLVDAAERARERIEYSPTATPGSRLDAGEATLTGHGFDSGAFVAGTFAPGYADDVEFGVGLSAMAAARDGHFEDVMLADAHNCNDGLTGPDLGHVVPGSKRAFDLIDGTERLAARLADAPESSLELGTAHDPTPWGLEDGIGSLGIRVALLRVDDHTTGYVLIDGNNMVPGLRQRILESVDGVDLLEVLTTDTHAVNTIDAENPVGGSIPEDELVALIDDLLERARDDIEPVEAGMATERAEVTVFGNDRTEMLASTANAVVSLGAPLAGAFIVAVLAISVLLFFLA